MKKIMLLLPLLMLFSCSVQKRKYQKGFYVNWHKQSRQQEKPAAAVALKHAPLATLAAVPEPVVAGPGSALLSSGDKSIGSAILKKKPLTLSPDSCDEILFRSGDGTRVKISEISESEIKYRRCDNLTGPLYVARKSDVFMVKYSNGTSETFKTELPATSSLSTYNTSRSRTKRVTHPMATLSIVAAGLAAVIGYFGLLFLSVAYGSVYGILLIPLVLGIAAVITGRIAINDIRAQPDVYKGKGTAVPGFIIGLVVAIIAALILLLILAL